MKPTAPAAQAGAAQAPAAQAAGAQAARAHAPGAPANELVPALRRAEPAEQARILLALGLEELRPVARAVLGMKRFNVPATRAAREAQAGRLRETILKVLGSGRRLDGAGLQAVGARLRDESGEEIEITAAMVERIHRLSDDLQRAEFAIQRGLADVCRSLAEFHDIKGFAYFGFPSFRAYCQAGRLEVLGQKRSHSWAMEQIQLHRTFGERVLAHVGPLPRRDLLRLASVLSGDGMEAALEELSGALRLTYTADDGRAVTLDLPRTHGDLDAWKQGLEALERDRRKLKRDLARVQDDLALARESSAQEADALRAEVAALQSRIAESQGRTEAVLARLAADDAAELAPAQVGQLQAGLRESLARTRQLAADLAARQARLDELSGRLEAHNAEADATARLTNVQQIMARFRDKAEAALRELAPLREIATILRPEAVTVVAGTIAAVEAQLRDAAAALEAGG